MKKIDFTVKQSWPVKSPLYMVVLMLKFYLTLLDILICDLKRSYPKQSNFATDNFPVESLSMKCRTLTADMNNEVLTGLKR